MSIKKRTYALCKAVWEAPDRERVRTVIADINAFTPEQAQTGNDRSHFGYLARQLHIEVLGYLLIDAEANRSAASTPLLAGSKRLREDERKLLAAVHQELTTLNRRCASHLLERVPVEFEVIDPYNRYNFTEPASDATVHLLADAPCEPLVQSFTEHPAASVAVEALQDAPELINELSKGHQLSKGIINFTQTLMNAGVENTPMNLQRSSVSLERLAPKRVIYRYIAALASFRASLKTLNALLYQAILSNRLPTLTEDNTIQLSVTIHMMGRGVTALCQPDDILHGIDAGLVLVKFTAPEEHYPRDLCQVESMDSRFAHF